LERLASARSSRSKTDVAKGLRALSRGAKNDENLMPLVLSAVEAGASEGEVMDVFRDVYGEFIDPGVF
jgi:methylmalonyl-CoA mutase N-terminal domain/subunit